MTMKRKLTFISLLGGFTLLLAGAIFISSCEGPMGPPGPAGTDGTDGINGVDGIDGTDGTDGVAGNAVCLNCHTSAVKDVVVAEYATTLHAMSQTFYPGSPTTVQYAGGRTDCAKCHSHEGFVETVWTGQDTIASEIPAPQPIRCKTCHDFHYSLDFENEPNSAIRQMMAVTLIAGGEEVGFDNMEANLCMHCHQARTSPADDADGAALVEVYEHYGPHHGPQANIINGLGGYEFGAALSTSGPHESMADCVSCHMHDGGTDNGGHTWVAGVEGCTGCHTGLTDFDYNGVKTEIEGLIASLEEALKDAGMLDESGHAIEDTTYQADSVGALWNFLLVEEDASHGIHNPDYTKALLNGSISIFN